MTSGARLTRGEWRTLALGCGIVLGALVAAAAGWTNALAWSALILGAIVAERFAWFLARRQPHPTPMPTAGIALATVAAGATIMVLGRSALQLPALTPGDLAWVLLCMAVTRVAATRITLLVHPPA